MLAADQGGHFEALVTWCSNSSRAPECLLSPTLRMTKSPVMGPPLPFFWSCRIYNEPTP